jgi:hypothetical protein
MAFWYYDTFDQTPNFYRHSAALPVPVKVAITTM